jgi:hypothetical protein
MTRFGWIFLALLAIVALLPGRPDPTKALFRRHGWTVTGKAELSKIQLPRDLSYQSDDLVGIALLGPSGRPIGAWVTQMTASGMGYPLDRRSWEEMTGLSFPDWVKEQPKIELPVHKEGN